MLAIIVATLVSFFLGMAWYSPALFGKQWMSETHMNKMDAAKKRDMKKGMGKMFAVQIVCTLVMVGVLSTVFNGIGVYSVGTAIRTAILIRVGFFLTQGIGAMLWEGQSQRMMTIKAGYTLVQLVLSAIILVIM